MWYEDTTCRIDVQNAIDKGEYDTAIADLKGKCATAFNSSDLNMNLASAYMGKSGYSVSDIADMLINSDNNEDAFSSFISSVDTKRKPDSLPLLNKASEYFTNAIARNGITKASAICTAAKLNLLNDSRVTNACLYIGFNETIKAANTITYLTGDVNKLVDSISNGSNATPYDMRASLDALAWMIDASYKPKSSDPTITPSDVKIGGYPFAAVKVKYSGVGTFYRLAKSVARDSNNTTVVTDGYCDVDGNRSACEGIENNDGSIEVANPLAASCYACPVIMDVNNTLGVAQLLVDTLNNGTDTISAVSNDPDIIKSIQQFKDEIKKDSNNSNTDITIADIIKYLQK